jgi:dipeptidyl aminopeptidase/acylaminoacyl peptidase
MRSVMEGQMRNLACIGTTAFAVLLVSACQPAEKMAAAAAPAQVTYDAKTFFDTTAISLASGAGYAFSPDGSKILLANDASGVWNAVSIPTTGGDATQLTTSPDNATYAISYFPADERLLVSADKGGDELNHVFVRGADGSLKDITPGEKTKAGFLGWSDDGKTMWLTSNERDPQMFDVYSYDTASFARKMVFKNTGYFADAVSGDGKWLSLTKDLSSANSDIYVVELSRPNAKPELISQHKGDVSYGTYEFTPDNKALVYATDEFGEYNQAWTYDLATKEKKELVKADWDVMFVTYSPTGKYRVSAVNADASTQLTILDTVKNAPVTLTGVPAGDVGNVRFNRDETSIAFTVVSDTSPADLFVADLSTGAATRLTKSLNPAIDENVLVEATVIRYPSFDGLEIPAILFKPKTASADAPVPAVVDVHGGPGGQNRRGYAAMYQHLVNHGYAVLRVNNRGSSGYGKTFYHMDDKKHGEVDLDDVVYGKKYLQTLDWVQKDKIGVMGGSYGGYMVAAALAFRPDEFDVGIDIFGVTNWSRTLASIPAWWGAQRASLYDEMGDPATDAERHQRISPLFHADGIKKPLLVIQGKNDPRVLQRESDELVAAVRASNVPVEYVIFPDEGHGFQRKENRIKASEAYLAFLDKYLKGEGAQAEQAER